MADEWITLEVDPSKLLGPVNSVIAAVDSVLEILIQLLNLANLILSVVKAFLVGLLDPIRALVEALLAELRALIEDLRQLGVYVCGDWKLIDPDNLFSDIVGGYGAYERRMIARLVNSNDPSRPNFSSNSPTLGIFLYVSSGDIAPVIKAVAALMKFFNGGLGGGTKAFPTPTTPKASFGTKALGIAAFGEIAKGLDRVPDAVAVTWTMPAGTANIPSLLAPAPYGFIIEVSTVPNGLLAVAVQPKDGDTSKVVGLPKITQIAIDPNNNQPLRVFGGLGSAGAGPDGITWTGLESGDAQAPRMYFQLDQNSPLIAPSSLISNGRPLLGNAYYLKAGMFPKMLPGQSFTVALERSTLPLHATINSDGSLKVAPETTQYYIRVRAVTEEIAAAFEGSFGSDGYLAGYPVDMFPTSFRLFRFDADTVRKVKSGAFFPLRPGEKDTSTIAPNSFSNATSPVAVTFPTALSLTYIKTIQSAVAVSILARSDLKEGFSADTFEKNRIVPGYATGMEQLSDKLFSKYGIEPSSVFIDPSPSGFRYRINSVLGQVSQDLYNIGNPPDSVASTVIDLGAPLLAFKWSDLNRVYPNQTILESLASDVKNQGLGANPYGRGLPYKFLEVSYDAGNGPIRTPCFYNTPNYSSSTWISGQGSADKSPVIYSDEGTGKVEFVRNALNNHQDGSILDSATSVLQVAAASLTRPVKDSEWITFKLIPQALAPLDDILDQLDKLLNGLLDGAQGLIDQIVSVIESVQARIFQLQALLEQIRALLRLIRAFKLPSMSGLVVVGDGTNGLLSSLITSQNKPNDAIDAYGAGALIVAGGLPALAYELLARMVK